MYIYIYIYVRTRTENRESKRKQTTLHFMDDFYMYVCITITNNNLQCPWDC